MGRECERHRGTPLLVDRSARGRAEQRPQLAGPGKHHLRLPRRLPGERRAGEHPVTGQRARQHLTDKCLPIITDFASGQLEDSIDLGPESIAKNLLGRYPLGDGYDAKRKFTDYNKWECLGYLLIL